MKTISGAVFYFTFLRPLQQEGAQSGLPAALSLKIGTLLENKR